jgi:Ca2+:H+ antiporter
MIIFGMVGFEDAEFIPAIPRFILNILCTVPITFYIGMAISSISVQTSYMIGAILNATFGSITELLLFTLAIRKGHFTELILYSLTGSPFLFPSILLKFHQVFFATCYSCLDFR